MKGYKHTMGKNAVDFNSISASSAIVGSDGVKLEENPSSFPAPSLLNNLTTTAGGGGEGGWLKRSEDLLMVSNEWQALTKEVCCAFR